MNPKIFSDSGNGIFIDFTAIFEMLNDELAVHNESLRLVCAGGYVLQLNGYRGTADVDAFFCSNAVIDNVIRKVGDIFGVNKPDELWLNNSLSAMNSMPPDKHCKLVHQFSNLTVLAVDLLYLVGMKLTSARGQDMKDVAEIIRNTEEQQPFELSKKLTEMGFLIDISVLLDAYGEALGMKWLEKFYNENEHELGRFF